MSIAKIQAAAAAAPGAYVTVAAPDLAAALAEAGEQPTKGSLAEHVAEKLRANPQAVMQVHREAHLGKILGVNAPAVARPEPPTLEA